MNSIEAKKLLYIVVYCTFPGVKAVFASFNLAEARAQANLLETLNEDKGETEYSVYSVDYETSLYTGVSQ